MTKFKTTFNRNTFCVFAVVDTDIQIHLANIDTKVNRIYTTADGYSLLATNEFKSNHKLQYFEEDSKTEYRKFNAIIDFKASELKNLISMCTRELVWG